MRNLPSKLQIMFVSLIVIFIAAFAIKAGFVLKAGLDSQRSYHENKINACSDLVGYRRLVCEEGHS
jgi:hypothetical protein